MDDTFSNKNLVVDDVKLLNLKDKNIKLTFELFKWKQWFLWKKKKMSVIMSLTSMPKLPTSHNPFLTIGYPLHLCSKKIPLNFNPKPPNILSKITFGLTVSLITHVSLSYVTTGLITQYLGKEREENSYRKLKRSLEERHA